MKMSGRFVLITVLLQLCLSVQEVNAGGGGKAGGKAGASAGASAGGSVEESVNENQLQFGDLLEFPQRKGNKISYSHYAVYVGSEPIQGKEDNNHNVFEMTKNPAGCHFSRKTGPFRRNNYLDPGKAKGKSLTPQSKEDMIHTIQNLRNQPVCQTYSLTKRNCEQIATKVRYGEAHCKQLGTEAENIAKIVKKPNIKRREASAAAA